MTPGLTLALSLALLAGKHWQLDIRSIECRAPQVAVGARIRYVGPKGAVEAPLSRLDQLAPVAKELLVEAMVATVTHDQQLTIGEAELLRAVCASVHCPLPPLVAS